MKRLPAGIDSFEKIITSGYYYLDKTMFIKTLVDTSGEVNLFTRPRRFGKSLIVSMLKSFFEIGSDPALFHGLAIEKEKDVCEKYQGKYPVVSITLKGIEGPTYEVAVRKMEEEISILCQKYESLIESEKVAVRDKKRLRELIDMEADETALQYSLKTLMRVLHAHYGSRVILLIDEYDVPLDKSNENGYYDNMVGFLRAFFGEAFKTNPDLQFAVLTGCLRISKESIFTGINNLCVDSISDKRFDEYFGFTDENVKTILADYGLNDRYEEMREWYDGYRFGDADVYCPWDVINHCRALLSDPVAKPRSYWDNTSSNAFVKLFIDKADDRTREDIERLIAGEAIERPLTENLTYAEVDKKLINLWSVLYLTGYLTQDKEKAAEKEGCVRLVIPNKEVRSIFVNKIQSWFEEKLELAADTLSEMYRALGCGDVETAEQIISELLRYTISYYDQKEDFYHGFLIGLLSGNKKWKLTSNRETGLGRSDIMMKEYGKRRLGIIIEVKRTDREIDMNDKCEEALRQIEEKRYAAELEKLMDTVWIYGIAFAEKSCRIKAKKLK